MFKTGKWWKIPLFLIGGLFLLAKALTAIDGGMEVAGNTCDGLAPAIIKLSEEDKNPLTPVILKIYDIETKQHPSHELDCAGTATTSRGNDMKIGFYLYKDKDGDYFHGYEPLN